MNIIGFVDALDVLVEKVQLRTENVAGGLMEEDARIWDSEGNLVALSRQLCGWRVPRG